MSVLLSWGYFIEMFRTIINSALLNNHIELYNLLVYFKNSPSCFCVGYQECHIYLWGMWDMGDGIGFMNAN